MYLTTKMGKPTGKKTTEIKCKLDTGASISGMSLTKYQLVNPSGLNGHGYFIGGHGQERTILKDYNDNPHPAVVYKGHF